MSNPYDDENLPIPPNIFPFLNFRLITPRDILAVEYIHHKLFPIRYDHIFYEKICKEEEGPETITSSDGLNSDYTNKCVNNDFYSMMEWKAEHIIGIGVFYKQIDKHINFGDSNGLNQRFQDLNFKDLDCESRNGFKEYGNQLLESEQEIGSAGEKSSHRISNSFLVGDEYLIGVITFLMNFPDENFLDADKSEYQKFHNHYQHLISQTNTSCKCRKVNTEFVNLSIYNMLINCLYSNDALINRLTKVLYNKPLESVYILTAGVIDSFQRKGIGSTLVLFVQLLFQRALYHKVLTFTNGTVTWEPSCQTENFEKEMPPFIYLHVIDYNEAALKMYYNVNMVKITTVKNYYTLDQGSYDANILGCYIEPQQ